MKIQGVNAFFDESGKYLMKILDGVEFRGRIDVGAPCVFMKDCVIEAKTIGAYTTVGANTVIAKNVEIGRYCTIGERCCIGDNDMCSNLTFSNALADIDLMLDNFITIGNDVKIDDDVIVRKGVTIGDGAIILANSVVIDDILPFSIVEGNPAVKKQMRFPKSVVHQIEQLRWWDYDPEIFAGLSGRQGIEAISKSIKKASQPRNIYLFVDGDNKKIISRREKTQMVIYSEECVEEKIHGGISASSSFYNAFSNKLYVAGWLLPSRAYDEIEIYFNDVFLGNAERYIPREDVLRDHPEYKELRCGFSFEKEIPIEQAEIAVKAVIKKRGIVVTEKETTILKITKETLYSGERIDYEKLKVAARRMHCKSADLLKEIKLYDQRKILACYGNCQINNILSLIETSNILKEMFLILYWPPIQLMSEEERTSGLSSLVLKEIDLFIYQNVAPDNKFSKKLASAELLKSIREDAMKVCIPNVYWTGYFPQFCANKFNPSFEGIRGGLFPYGDKNIVELWKEHSVEDVAYIVSQEDFYSRDEVLKNANESLEKLKSKESLCDVKISDFIESEYKEHYLFYTVNHPTNYLLKELVKRIFSYLSIKVSDIDEEIALKNDSREIAIYPSVKKALGLRFEKEKFTWLSLLSKPASFQDYVKDYINYCILMRNN